MAHGEPTHMSEQQQSTPTPNSPTAPVAAAVVPSSPAVPTVDDTPDAQAIIDRVMQEVAPGAADEQPRNELGQFVSKVAAEAVASTDPTPATPDAPPPAPAESVAASTEPVEPTEPVLPEGFAAVKPIEGRELAAQFAVLDAEGELAIPDVTIAFVANGRERREPLDKVVKLAQMGVYNHEREQKITQQQEEARQVQAQFAEAQQALQQYQQYVEQLLSDETAYLTEQERFALQNTPEARLQRERERLAAEQQQFTMRQQMAQAEGFVSQQLLPAMDLLAASLDTVSKEEIAAKLVVLMQPYQRNGFVPPEHHTQIKQLLAHEVLPWAEQLHEERLSWRQQASRPATPSSPAPTSSAPSATAAATAATNAQANAQKEKRRIGAVLRPVVAANTAPQTRETPRPAPPPATAREAIESSVQDILGQMQAAG
ncbi:MAG: hypothetical protein ACYC3F_17150 [Gemmatimonadaceae bacterium]